MFGRKIAVILVFASALGLGQVAGAGVIKSNTITPLSATVYDPCMKETIVFSGNVHTVAIIVTAPSPVPIPYPLITNVKLLSNYQGVSGVGQETGQTYQVSNTSSTNLIQRINEGGDLETVNYTEHEFGRLAQNNALFSFKTHYTVKPSGDVVASFTDLEVKCTGETVGETPDLPLEETGWCFNSFDDDNDGVTDCADTDCVGAIDGACDTGLPGVCSSGTLQCVSSTLACMPSLIPEAELNCADGLDNDCDGLTDGADPDCAIIP